MNGEQDVATAMKKLRPYIAKLAYKYHRRGSPMLEFEDLVSVGQVGLLEAMERFDPSRDCSLATFAQRRIHGAMQDEVRKCRGVTRNLATRYDAMQRGRDRTYAITGERPTFHEVGARYGLTVAQIEDSVRAVQHAVSLDAEIGHEDPGGWVSLHDITPDPHATNPYDATERNALLRDYAACKRGLPPHLIQYCQLYFEEGLTMTQVGQRMGCTESNVCRRIKFAMQFLRTCEALKAWTNCVPTVNR